MNLAFCLGFRNWYSRHLQRCLETIRAHSDLPIVLADLGDDPAFVDDLTHGYSIFTIHHAQPEWSRSLALNMAAQWAASTYKIDWLCFTDADMLFPRSWFEIARQATALVGLTGMPLLSGLWLTRSRDLSEQATGLLNLNMPDPKTEDWSQWDHWLFRASTPHGNDLGQGAAMLVPRAWFGCVGGFDEYYKVWGCEDNDLTARASWNGLSVQWLPTDDAYIAGKWGVGSAWVAHQWHRRDWPTPTQVAQVKRNREYFYQRLIDKGPLVRNQKEI